MTYVEDKYSRKNSGAPGYIKGKAVKTGTLEIPTNNPTKSHIKEPINAFPFIGADNTGLCYSVKDSIIMSLKNEAKQFKMTDFKDIRYYEDPTLTFEDSILTGCHVDLNRKELETFCQTKAF